MQGKKVADKEYIERLAYACKAVNDEIKEKMINIVFDKEKLIKESKKKRKQKRINLRNKINGIYLAHFGNSMSDIVLDNIVKLIGNFYRRRVR